MRKRERIADNIVNLFKQIALVISGLVLIVGLIYSENNFENAYQKHFERIRHLLPTHSDLPPVLDLQKPGENSDGASRAWEERFTGMMSVRQINDPGISYPSDVASVATTFTEYATPVWALPVHDCAVVIGTPTTATAHISHNRRFVYSVFTLHILHVLKQNGYSNIQNGRQITTAEFGGTIRFPSGHMGTFIMAQEGFIGLSKRYLLFIWKPVRSDQTYVVAEAYLIEGGDVFPINLDAHQARYQGMPFQEFEAKVKSAIAKNVDTN
jgi:hypothetical protein